MRTLALNKIAAEFFSALVAVYPEWERYIALDEHLLAPRGCLLFEVPCPSTMVAQPLSISTSPEEITIGFDTGHSHFAGVAEAVAHIRSLVGEQSVIESWYAGARFLGCTVVAPGSAHHVPDYIHGVTRVTRRSWRGTHDSDTETA